MSRNTKSCAIAYLVMLVLVMPPAATSLDYVSGALPIGSNSAVIPRAPVRAPEFGEADSMAQRYMLGDTLFQFSFPTPCPTGLAWDGQFFWNQDASRDSIYKRTVNGELILSFPAPGGASGDLEWCDSALWAVDEEAAMLYKINPVYGFVINQFRLPHGYPNGWGIAFDGTYLWYSQYSDGRIYKIDPSNGSVIFAFTPPEDLILGIAWDGECICGVDIASMTLFRMDPETGAVVESLPWQVPYPLGLKFINGHFLNISSSPGYWPGQLALYRIPANSVSVNLTSVHPPIQIPPAGGSFQYSITIGNYTDTLTVGDIWCSLILPDGALLDPVYGPVSQTMAIGFNASRMPTLTVPATAPAGVYKLMGKIGIYPQAAWDRHFITFVKLAGENAGIAGNWIEGVSVGSDEALANNSSLNVSAVPNPFNPTTAISYQLSANSYVQLRIYDIAGREVAKLVDGWREAGNQEVTFDGSSLPSGIYFAKIEAAGFAQTIKMVLMK